MVLRLKLQRKCHQVGGIDMFYKKIIGCKQVLNILKDGKLHYNRDMWDVLGGGFALAARIWELRKPKIDGGKYELKIESGNPEHFNKVRQSRGDWYYQMATTA